MPGDVRPTSLAAYRELCSSGKLGSMQLKVYRELWLRGAMTGRELNDELETPNAHKRLSELERMGMVEMSEEPRRCAVTGRNAIAWRATTRTTPKPLDTATSPGTKAERYRELCLKLVTYLNGRDPDAARLLSQRIDEIEEGRR